MLSDLKSKLSKQMSLFVTSTTNERESLIGSYEVCLQLVKHKKSSRKGKLTRRCAIKMANAFTDSKITESLKLSHSPISDCR
jgi:hypothetical protein